MEAKDFQKRAEVAFKLLTQESTNREKFDSIRKLIKGYNPKVDNALEKVSTALASVEKFDEGEYIELGAQALPENTEEEKKRKKAILTFIRNWKELTLEVERVRKETSNQENGDSSRLESSAKILKYAKGPFGIITIAAVVIVAIFGVLNIQKTPKEEASRSINETSAKQTIQVIIVGDKKILLSEVHAVTGPECDKKPHYHARTNSQAKATDGTNVADPGGCGYGKVEEIKVEEVDLPQPL